MTKLTKSDIAFFAARTDEELRATFDNIGKHPCHRVKRTGFVKLRFAKYGDQILAELHRRRSA